MTGRRSRRSLAAAGAALALAAAPLANAAGSHAKAGHARPIQVLVFDKAFGFVHTSIKTGAKYFASLNKYGEFHFVNTTKVADLKVSNLRHYDVLVWNNSTGDVPLSAQDKSGLLAWVRAGHGFVGIHSAGDSNYGWPQFAELAGGLFQMHYYDFGGSTAEPQTLVLRNEDPNNPITRHLGGTWAVSDETYRWQVDPRPDVHVLLSMVNSSIAEGAFYYQSQPIAWCRPYGDGRTFYTNQGHLDSLFQNADYVTEVLQGIRYASGRVAADCNVPAAAGRDEAVWADRSVAAPAALSNESGGLAVVTGATGTTQLTWTRVDIGGTKSIEVHTAGESQSSPPASGSPAQWQPSSGGTVTIHLDGPKGPTVGTVSVLPGAGWATTSVSVPTTLHGTHALVLTFSPNAPGNALGSIAWIRIVPRPGDRGAR